MLNNKAGGHAKHARTGKDGALYDSGGNLMATVESFTAQVSMNNAQYQVLGNSLELEAQATHKVTLTFSQICLVSDKFLSGLMDFFKNGKTINWTFQGVVKGINGSEERIVYKNCIPSGQIDLQNLNTGDVVKRNWSFNCNSEPVLQKKLTI